MAMVGQHRCPLGEDRKRFPLQEDQPFWEPFHKAKPVQLNAAALARAYRPFFLEALKSDGNAKVCSP